MRSVCILILYVLKLYVYLTSFLENVNRDVRLVITLFLEELKSIAVELAASFGGHVLLEPEAAVLARNRPVTASARKPKGALPIDIFARKLQIFGCKCIFLNKKVVL